MIRLGSLIACAVVAALCAAARPSPAATACVTASDKAYAVQHAKRHSAAQLRKLVRLALACTSGQQRIGFWPQGGLLDHDLYLTNTVDLAGGGLRDPWCGSRTYDGHTGEDVIIRSFREQATGVPVFAALDGRVSQVQEGAKDTNYGSQTLPWDNHVQIDSGHDQMTIYGHLRRGSVRVRIGDWVVAGQQIGLTGSSGNSSWPHLHLTMIAHSEPVDLWAGPCNATSYWQEQPTLSSDAFARDFTLSARPFDGRGGLPWDEGTRTGTFSMGTRDLYFRSMLLNAEQAQSQTVRLLRPDGSEGRSTTSSPSWQRFRQAVATWHERVALDVVGTWRIQVDVDGRRLLDQPFDVVAQARANRPPAAVRATVSRTADGVWLCQVGTDLLHADPDYDLVSYRYAWRERGRLVRALRGAGLQDALPRTIAGTPACSVTPTDGRLNGPTASA
jgi:murein DD-endopeptidase MepM/ murein hydrolase activator NlpD